MTNAADFKPATLAMILGYAQTWRAATPEEIEKFIGNYYDGTPEVLKVVGGHYVRSVGDETLLIAFFPRNADEPAKRWLITYEESKAETVAPRSSTKRRKK